MAAPAIEAFGAYLRDLRERRRLSLDDVESLSSAFPDPVGKAYLSRCENGKLKIAFSKTIALGRIYEVPSEVLAERMRLDLEIDRLGTPDTTGMTFREMFKAAWDAGHEGRIWDAYAYARDAVPQSRSEPLIDRVASIDEQRLAARMTLASMASTLGGNAFALFELESIDEEILGVYYQTVLMDRLQSQYRHRGETARAALLGDSAVALAEAHGLEDPMPALLENRARTFVAEKLIDRAILCQQDAIRRHDQRSHSRPDRIYAYIRLAEIYLDAGRSAAARRVLKVPLRDARELGLGRTEAQVLCLLGDAEHQDEQPARAVERWKRASVLSRRHHDQRLRFMIQFRLFRHAKITGDAPSVRSIGRRLDRLLPSIPRRLPEAQEYIQLRR